MLGAQLKYWWHQKEKPENFRRWLSIHVIFYFNPVFVPIRLLLYVEV